MSINETYKKLLIDAYTTGIETYPRGMRTKELIAARIEINPYDNIITLPGFKTNLSYATAELDWYMSGSNKIADLGRYAYVWDKYSEDGKTVNSAYGYQMLGNHPDTKKINQLEWVAAELKRDPDSRRAVVNINFPSHKLALLDMPCLHGGTRIHSLEKNYTIATLARKFKSGEIDRWPIWTFNESTNELELDWMLSAWKKPTKEHLVRIEFTTGHLLCTAEHLVLVKKMQGNKEKIFTEWVKAAELQPDDIIISIDTKQCKVVSVHKLYRYHDVYDFTTAINHNAFVNNGICVHNCTLALQFLNRVNKLHMFVYMRSNDLYYGFRNDIYCFAEIQKRLANHLNIEAGKYFHLAGSLHLYETEFAKVEELISNG